MRSSSFSPDLMIIQPWHSRSLCIIMIRKAWLKDLENEFQAKVALALESSNMNWFLGWRDAAQQFHLARGWPSLKYNCFLRTIKALSYEAYFHGQPDARPMSVHKLGICPGSWVTELRRWPLYCKQRRRALRCPNGVLRQTGSCKDCEPLPLFHTSAA